MKHHKRGHFSEGAPVPPSGTGRLPIPVAAVLAHGVLAYLVWLLLFITKWFPYGILAEVRDWLYRYF